MCGIAGFIRNGREGADARDLISSMSELLRHRGPDDCGYFIDDRVALGHRRLKIIDLDKGNQPITNEDSSVVIIFNGEIYNYKELRRELELSGHKFYTNTDTETIVHLYEDLGRGCVNKLNGIFSFAIWDRKLDKLLLARDRLGVKPLYYLNSGGEFVFASEIKSILRYPNIDKKIDNRSLLKYLIYEFIPAPNSIFLNIKKVLPAHILEYDLNKSGLNIYRYWQPDYVNKFDNITEEDALGQLLAILRGIIRKELVSDVPIGLFLSGGIDSSALAFLMSEVGQVNSFCIGFEDESFDESKYARNVANYLGLRHREQILSSGDVRNTIPLIPGFLDEPLADPSIIPTYLLSKFARKYITVALGGDGGDELFAGYDTYQAHRLAEYFCWLPKNMKNAIYKLIDILPVSKENMSLDFKLKKFKNGIGYSPEIRNSIWLGAFKDTEIRDLMQDNYLINTDFLFEDINACSPETENIRDKIERIQYLDLRFYLQDDILVKVDRASMYNSLEVRVPFLNHELVDFVTRLPARMKLNGFKTKFILKKAIRGKVPDKILQRRKKGFGIPVAKWINHDLKDIVLEYLNSGRLKKEGFFNPVYVKGILDEHFKGIKDNRKKIWTLFIFQLWQEKYINS